MKTALKDFARKRLTENAYDKLADGVIKLEALLRAPANRLKVRTHANRLARDKAQSCRMFDYQRAMLPNPLLGAVDGTDLETTRQQTGLTMGYPAWNLLYYSLLCSLPPDVERPVVVETGTNVGLSTIALAQAVKDAGRNGMVHTVDIDGEIQKRARANVEAAGLTHLVTFHVADSCDFLRKFVNEVEAIHFAFLDGSHVYGDVRREFEIIHPRVVACRGKVYFDNTNAGGVARALRYIGVAYSGNLVEFQNCSWMPPGNAIWQPS